MGYNYSSIILKKRIERANMELNRNPAFVLKTVYRCVFKGAKDENIPADFIYHGEVEHGVIVSVSQVGKHLRRRLGTWDYMENLHIGPLTFKPHARYTGVEVAREKSRHKVDFKWPNLYSDLYYIEQRYSS